MANPIIEIGNHRIRCTSIVNAAASLAFTPNDVSTTVPITSNGPHPPEVEGIMPPKLEKMIWGSALSLTKQAKELYNKKNFNELLNIKNELEYRVNKRKKFQQPPWKPTNEALEYVINLLGKNN